MNANYSERISFYDDAEIFATAYNKTANVEKFVNGFRACGLWAYNDAVFSDEDFPAAVALAGGLGTFCPKNLPSIKKRKKPAEKVNQSMNENDIFNSTLRPTTV